MRKLFFPTIISIIALAGYAREISISDSIPTATERTKPNLINFDIALKMSHLWRGLVISASTTAMFNINYALDKKQNLTVDVWGGKEFDWGTKKLITTFNTKIMVFQLLCGTYSILQILKIQLFLIVIESQPSTFLI